MPSLKDLRNRIRSVKSTQQITKTMKMVAAAKMRRAEQAAQMARPYGAALNRVLQDLAMSVPASSAPLLLRGRDHARKVRLVVFGSDRGLCGGFNGQIARLVKTQIAEHKRNGKTVDIVTVGRKAYDELRLNYGDLITARFDTAAREMSYASADHIAVRLMDDFSNGKCDEVYMLFSTFVNVLRQDPTVVKLIPFRPEAETSTHAIVEARPAVEYEPEEEVILQRLLPLNVATQLFRALLETQASEQGARMSAMDSATRNAGDMIGRLGLQYNRQRQANITREITEIVSGAEAL